MKKLTTWEEFKAKRFTPEFLQDLETDIQEMGLVIAKQHGFDSYEEYLISLEDPSYKGSD